MRKLWFAFLIAAMTVTALPAHAAQFVYSGSGTVTSALRSSSAPALTIAAGDQLTFRFSFDTDNAYSLFDGGPSFQVFAQPLTIDSIVIGGRSFTPDLGAATPPALLLGTGFRVLPGDMTSSAVVNQSFIIPGTTSGGLPFASPPTFGATFSLESALRRDLAGAPVTIADVFSPSDAALNRFTLVASSDGRNIARIEGAFTGALSTGAVPEPATWVMLIAGFGLIGATLRRRRRVEQPSIHALCR